MMNWNKIQSIKDLLTMCARQFQKRNENLKKVVLHLKRMKKQNKKLFDDEYQLRKIFLNADDLMLKHDIKLDNKHDLKLIFRWDESFRIQRANSIKEIFILKEMNKTRRKRTYAGNRLKQFKTKNIKNSSTKQIEVREIWNITSENSTDAMKKSNIVNRNVGVIDEV